MRPRLVASTVWYCPQATDVMHWLSSACSRCGCALSCVSPTPSCPKSLRPNPYAAVPPPKPPPLLPLLLLLLLLLTPSLHTMTLW